MWALKHLFSNTSTKKQLLKKDTLSAQYDITSYTPTNHTNASICMIDIVNFSYWCSDKSPQEIFFTMTNYNGLISNLINEYTDVDKIELVGDSILIMAGFRGVFDAHVNAKNIVNLAIDIISNLENIVQIFDTNCMYKIKADISVRIGIHCGAIYSGFIENPRKFQLFGNSINIASRLESYSLPGTFTISQSTYDHLNSTDISPRISEIIGKQKHTVLKGVGNIGCIMCFLPKKDALIADDDLNTIEIFKRLTSLKYKLNSKGVNTIKETFDLMKQNTYPVCILDVHFIDVSVWGSLREFRNWESVFRRTRQKVILTTTCIDVSIKKEYSEFVDGYIDKMNMYQLDVYPLI
jgi:class 3 adenylate cyclase